MDKTLEELSNEELRELYLITKQKLKDINKVARDRAIIPIQA